jgi:hypothetical protein
MEPSLKDELAIVIKTHSTWGVRNNVYAHIVFAVSILASFLAAIFAAGDLAKTLFGESGGKIASTALAAVPGIILLINNTLKYEQRMKWFWRKVRVAERYARVLRDDPSADVKALSAAFSKESEQLEDDWPSSGGSPGKPKNP